MQCENPFFRRFRLLGCVWPARLSYGATSFVLSILLFVAGVLKAEQSLGGVDPSLLAFSVVVFEFLLAACLISRVYTRLIWCVTTLTFFIFATVASAKLFLGEQSCGCFGSISFPPWAALAIDVAALLSLLRVRSQVFGRKGIKNEANKAGEPSDGNPNVEGQFALPMSRSRNRSTGFQGYSRVIAATGLLMLLVGWFGVKWYGSMGAVRTAMAGYRIHLDKRLFDVGNVATESECRIRVRVANVTRRELAVVGSRSSCNCSITLDLPVTVPPNGSIEIPLLVRAPRSGHFEVAVRLLTDHPAEQPVVTIRGFAQKADRIIANGATN